MHRILIVVALLVAACESAPESKYKPFEGPVPPAPHEVAVQNQPKPNPFPNWDPNQPVELTDLPKRTFFVIADSVSICPTQEQAKANECGNSVESKDKGYRHYKGQLVTVVGEPEDGFIRAIRFTKMGTLPSWVDATRVADAPTLDGVTAFKKANPNATTLKANHLILAGEAPEYEGDESPVSPAVFIHSKDGVDTAYKTPSCFALADNDKRYMLFHGCLMYADCRALEYICQEDYCDEIVVTTTPSEDFVVGNKTYKAHQITALADRMGTFVPCKDE